MFTFPRCNTEAVKYFLFRMKNNVSNIAYHSKPFDEEIRSINSQDSTELKSSHIDRHSLIHFSLQKNSFQFTYLHSILITIHRLLAHMIKSNTKTYHKYKFIQNPNSRFFLSSYSKYSPLFCTGVNLQFVVSII